MDINEAVEKIKAKKLNYWEEAEALRDICDTGITQETLSNMIGLKQSSVSNKMRILKLPQEVIELVKSKGNPERYARVLLKFRSKSQQIEIFEHITKFGLNIRETEEYIDKYIQASNKLRHEKELASIIIQGGKKSESKRHKCRKQKG